MDDKRLIYPLELILTGLNFLKNTRFKKSCNHDPVRHLLCYNLTKVKDGYLVLNRDYKPIGLMGGASLSYSNEGFQRDSEWADYEKYPFLCIPEESINCKPLEKFNGIGGVGWYFFSDSTFPRDAKTIQRYEDLIKNVFGEVK